MVVLDCLPLRVLMDVEEWELEGLQGVNVADTVEELDTPQVCVGTNVYIPAMVGRALVGVGRGGEGEGVAVLPLPPPSTPHPQGLTLGEPLTESDAVKLSTKDTVGAEDTVALGEAEEVEVDRGEALPVLETRAVTVAAPLPVTLAVTLVPLPREVVGVGVEEGVPWTVHVLLRVLAPLPVPA